MTRPTIVFDLDGTLVDTAVDLLDSLNHCLGTVGMAQTDLSNLRAYVGRGARVMITRAFEAQDRRLAPTQLDSLFAVFLDHYSDNIPGVSRPFAGVSTAINRFEDAGYRLAICTNKLEKLAIDLIGALGLSQHFSVITGADTYDFRKPDPRHLIETILEAGGDPEKAVLIGDSETDIATAKAARVPVIAVDFGYTDRHVSAFGPTHIISHYDELTVPMTTAIMRKH